MTDNLKKFIAAHREEFDDEQPRPGLLGNIMRLHRKGPQRSRLVSMLLSRWAAAAACAIIVMTVALIAMKPGKTERTDVAVDNGTNEVLEQTDPIYALQISQFRQVINLQQEELKKLKAEHPELYNQFSRDISTLDSAYSTLKHQLFNNPNKETLLEAMIANLQLQTDLLSRQLNIIRQIKQTINSHEKART